ncbi:MAG: polymerase delta subunit [Gemmatimonadetes bacterium]|nr:polymerase delta subunit [Gemmatimonadota bacterium]
MASAGEKTLQAALKKREFDPVYYFYGDDDFLKDGKVREIVDVAVDPATRDFNFDQRRGAELDAEALDSLLSTPPMLAERRIAIIRDVDKLKKDARKFLDGYLKRPATDMLLLLVSPCGIKADKGLTDHSTSVEFAPLSGDRVARWVTYHVETVLERSIAPGAVSLLVEAAGDELAQLAVELEKLASFSDGEITEQAVSAVVGVRRGETAGDLLDAIGARDAARALELLPGVLQQPKVNAVTLVMSLATQMLAFAYGEAARARGVPARNLYNEYMNLLKETGAFPGRPWGEAVNAWSKHSEQWTAEQLDSALATLLTADEQLKDTRVSSDEQMLTSLVLALCGAGAARRAA